LIASVTTQIQYSISRKASTLNIQSNISDNLGLFPTLHRELLSLSHYSVTICSVYAPKQIPGWRRLLHLSSFWDFLFVACGASHLSTPLTDKRVAKHYFGVSKRYPQRIFSPTISDKFNLFRAHYKTHIWDVARDIICAYSKWNVYIICSKSASWTLSHSYTEHCKYVVACAGYIYLDTIISCCYFRQEIREIWCIAMAGTG
jgi:hypothetical protein